MRWFATLTAVLVLALVFAATVAQAKRAARTPSPSATAVRAITQVFGPRYASQALRVAWCESRYYIWASNGQYLGLFQMGSSERRIYGHGSDPWSQARAAYRYFVASGRDWSPWQCKP